MRINPLVIPLMVVLVAPFAVGIASTSTLAQPQNTGSSTGSVPICANCVLGPQIQKLMTQVDAGCGYSTHGQDPNLQFTGICQEYICNNGYYWSWSGWTATINCLDEEQDAAPCPTGTCGMPANGG